MTAQNIEDLKTKIANDLQTNGNNSITASVLRGVLNNMVDTMGVMKGHMFIGDNTGATDVTAEMELAIEEAAAAGVPLFVPAGDYLVNNLDPDSSINIYGIPRHTRFLFDLEYQAINSRTCETHQQNSPVQTTVSAVDYVVSDDDKSYTSDSEYVTRLTVASVTGFSPGDIVRINSDDFEPWGDSRYGEDAVISSIVGNYVYLNCKLEHHEEYTTSIYLTKYKTDRTFSCRGIDFVANGNWRSNATIRNGDGGFAINIWGFPRANVDDCRFYELWTGGVCFRFCPYYTVTNCEFFHLVNFKTATPDEPFDTNPLTTVNGEAAVYVAYTAHGLTTGDHIIIGTNGSETALGGIPAGEIYDVGLDVVVVDEDNFKVITTTAATSSAGPFGGDNIYLDWRSGRLGYGVLSYGCTGGVVSNCEFHQCRHAYTDGSYESSGAFSNTNWLRYATNNKCIVHGCVSYDAWGVPWDTHEQSSGIIFIGLKTLWPNRGPDGGSYAAYGVQNRGRNFTILDYYQEGGTYGIRQQAVAHKRNVSFMNNITLKNLVRQGSNTGQGIQLNSISGLAEDNKSIVHVGTIKCHNVETGMMLEGGNVVRIDDLTCTGCETAAIEISPGGDVFADRIYVEGSTYGVYSQSNNIKINNLICKDIGSDGLKLSGTDPNTAYIGVLDVDGASYGVEADADTHPLIIDEVKIRNATTKGLYLFRDTTVRSGYIDAVTTPDGIEVGDNIELTIGNISIYGYTNTGIQGGINTVLTFDRLKLVSSWEASTYGIYCGTGMTLVGTDLITNQMDQGGIRASANSTIKITNFYAADCDTYAIKFDSGCVCNIINYVGTGLLNEHFEGATDVELYITYAYADDGKAFIDAQKNTLSRVDFLTLDYKNSNAAANCYAILARSDITDGGSDTAIGILNLKKRDNDGIIKYVFHEQDTAAEKKIHIGTLIQEDSFGVGRTELYANEATTFTWNDEIYTQRFESTITLLADTSLTQAQLSKSINVSKASAITITLPSAAHIGEFAEFIQTGVGQITFAAASGASIQNTNGHTKSSGQYAVVKARVVANAGGEAAVWILSGDTGV